MPDPMPDPMPDRAGALAAALGRVRADVTPALAPPVRRARAWVDAGHLGLPRSVNVECLGGTLGDAVDLARALTGCEPIEVYAEGTATALVASLLMTHGVVASLVVADAPGLSSITARLIGSHAHTEIDLAAPAVRRHGPDGVRLLPVETTSGGSSDYTLHDAAIAAGTSAAAHQSIATGQPVAVPQEAP
ncbi:hypothetical protein KZZ52_44780 [Dactylosporangium sp. AC04546]|uniref:hypothetical protein n=1 Tax=Dactylosporangium sp. AC04546 TaxID=2862460 RepID=UPI001EE05699|nr:hypothetical protein [Dactylosporangium sp. AC04546]WVK81032.1 hypothetical protein KZZ52_44780 [Dactylosporangium sp. AC04546]